MIQDSIAKFVQYGLETGLILHEDAIYTANRVLELLGIDTLEEAAESYSYISGRRRSNRIGIAADFGGYL